jgi:hypothetical protein
MRTVGGRNARAVVRARVQREHREQRDGHACRATGRESRERSLASPDGDASRGYRSKRDTNYPHDQDRAERRQVSSPIRTVGLIHSFRALQSGFLACRRTDGQMDDMYVLALALIRSSGGRATGADPAPTAPVKQGGRRRAHNLGRRRGGGRGTL